MPKITYTPKNFNDSTLNVINQAVSIINEYTAQGYSLTLRQLYYQFVARDLLPNKQKEYSRLGRIVNDARKAGFIDWKSIEDRTRSLTAWRHFDNPSHAIRHASYVYNIDKWEHQNYYIEIWIEKDALAGVLQKICSKLDLPYFSCRGYTSAPEMWKASQRLLNKTKEGKKALVLHLGDHDPSGIDMTRDIELRLNEYAVPPRQRGAGSGEWTNPEYIEFNREFNWPIELKRIALNMDQIQELNPPPNPAKVTDSRFDSYLREYGHQSWELDALEPQYISDLIENEVNELIDEKQWEADQEREETDTNIMDLISNHYDEVEHFVRNLNDEED